MKCEDKLRQIEKVLGGGEAGDLSVVVLHRGWIFVGELSVTSNGGFKLTSCRNVRKWSTGGFGGLTMGRKSSGATLDKCQPLTFSPDAAIFISELPKEWDDV